MSSIAHDSLAETLREAIDESKDENIVWLAGLALALLEALPDHPVIEAVVNKKALDAIEKHGSLWPD